MGWFLRRQHAAFCRPWNNGKPWPVHARAGDYKVFLIFLPKNGRTRIVGSVAGFNTKKPGASRRPVSQSSDCQAAIT
jgi:hypothetical protein